MLSRQILKIGQTFAIVLFASSYATHATAAEPCKAAIGQWNWFIGGKVALAENGDARWTPAVASMVPASGTWRCDPQAGAYIVTWQNGFIDTLTLSADGSKLNGTSSTGAAVSGWRGVAPAAAPAATPAAKTPPQLVPPGSKGGWIPGGNRPPQKGPKPFEGW